MELDGQFVKFDQAADSFEANAWHGVSAEQVTDDAAVTNQEESGDDLESDQNTVEFIADANAEAARSEPTASPDAIEFELPDNDWIVSEDALAGQEQKLPPV